MAYLEWSDVGDSTTKRTGGGSNAGKFMRLEANKTYTVRPVHKPIMFYKYFNKKDGQNRNAICDNPGTCLIGEKYPELRASTRYAILVLDRGDDNTLKILEGPYAIFEKFKSFFDVNKDEPGGKKGIDFRIHVICPSGQKDRTTKYKIDYLDPSPFTEEEREDILSKRKDFDLIKIFASQDDDEIEKILFGDWSKDKDANTSTDTADDAGDDNDDDMPW